MLEMLRCFGWGRAFFRVFSFFYYLLEIRDYRIYYIYITNLTTFVKTRKDFCGLGGKRLTKMELFLVFWGEME